MYICKKDNNIYAYFQIRYGKALNVEDYRLFAMAITQRYVKPTQVEADYIICSPSILGAKRPSQIDPSVHNTSQLAEHFSILRAMVFLLLSKLIIVIYFCSLPYDPFCFFLQEDLEKDPLAQFLNSKGPKKFDRKKFNELPEEEKEKIRKAFI